MQDPSQEYSGLRVFVVEDDDIYRELLAFALSHQGHQVYVAENGSRAVELIDNAEPDIILLDMLMPVMDGLTFLHWLRDERQDVTPVLVLTCLDDRALVVEALVAGASDVLIKPVNLDTLTRKIESLMKRSAIQITEATTNDAPQDVDS